jgi:GNAT superfamily N-acetyltransferase
VISYRAFRNSDPPQLAEIWRSQPPERGLMQPMSTDLFEQFVLAKPYFDNAGLIVAVDEGRPVGFVHAAFGPTDAENGISTRFGVTCLVLVRPDYQRRGIGAELLARSEAYLRGRGAEVLYAGGIAPFNGFYLGLYGGSELPGVLDSDSQAQRLFLSQNYREIDRIHVLHRDLTGFRAPVDRQQMQVRRRSTVEAISDPEARSWWESCAWSQLGRTRFKLTLRDAPGEAATATFWSIQPLAKSWGVNAAGLVEMEVAAEQRRQGLGTFLLSEAFRQLQAQGVSLIEVQTMARNAFAHKLYEKLGFRRVDQGAIYRKEADANRQDADRSEP